MQRRIVAMIGLIFLVGSLTLSCTLRTTTPTHVDMRQESWWGMDPACSPGCPPAMQQRW